MIITVNGSQVKKVEGKLKRADSELIMRAIYVTTTTSSTIALN